MKPLYDRFGKPLRERTFCSRSVSCAQLPDSD
jgi:hypothetical protein